MTVLRILKLPPQRVTSPFSSCPSGAWEFMGVWLYLNPVLMIKSLYRVTLPEVPDIPRFLSSINSSDELAMVVRSHQCIDTVLGHLIVEALPNGHPRIVSKLPFNFKVDLCIALRTIRDDLAPMYASINKIRNGFAHNLEFSLETKIVTDLFNTLPPDLQKDLVKAHETSPIARFGKICGFAFIHLFKSLERLQFNKLVQQADSELTAELLADLAPGTDPKYTLAAQKQLEAKIEEIRKRRHATVDNSAGQK